MAHRRRNPFQNSVRIGVIFRNENIGAASARAAREDAP